MPERETLLSLQKPMGHDYWALLTLAGEYAYAGRDVVVAKVLEILGTESTYEVHNHHNFAWREEHLGRTYWVVRKGCTPAFPGQAGFVGSTMADESVILEGTDASSLINSTIHGAGRVMSRRQAKGKKNRPGLVDWRAVQDRMRAQGIELRGGAADEAPEVYKRLDDVLAAHADTIKVTHRLRPVGVAMAGANVFDPYKD